MFLRSFVTIILFDLWLCEAQAASMLDDAPSAAGAGSVKASRPMAPHISASAVSDNPIEEMEKNVLSIADAYLDYLTGMQSFLGDNIEAFLKASGYMRPGDSLSEHDRFANNVITSINIDILAWVSLRHNIKSMLEEELPGLYRTSLILSVIFGENLRVTESIKTLESYKGGGKLKDAQMHIYEDQRQATDMLLEELLCLMPAAYQADYRKYRPIYMLPHEGVRLSVKPSTLPDKTPIIDIRFPNGYVCRIPNQAEQPVLGIAPIHDAAGGTKADDPILNQGCFMFTLPSGVTFRVRQFPLEDLMKTIVQARKLLTGTEIPYRKLSEIYPGYVPSMPASDVKPSGGSKGKKVGGGAGLREEEEVSIVVKPSRVSRGKKGGEKDKSAKPMAAVLDTSAVTEGIPATVPSDADALALTTSPVLIPEATPAPAPAAAPVAVPAPAYTPTAEDEETRAAKAAAPLLGPKIPTGLTSASGSGEEVMSSMYPKLKTEQKAMLKDIVAMHKVHNYRWEALVKLVNALGGATVGKDNSGVFEFRGPTGRPVHIKTYYPHATGGNVNMYTIESLFRGLAKLGFPKEILRLIAAD